MTKRQRHSINVGSMVYESDVEYRSEYRKICISRGCEQGDKLAAVCYGLRVTRSIRVHDMEYALNWTLLPGRENTGEKPVADSLGLLCPKTPDGVLMVGKSNIYYIFFVRSVSEAPDEA